MNDAYQRMFQAISYYILTTEESSIYEHPKEDGDFVTFYIPFIQQELPDCQDILCFLSAFLQIPLDYRVRLTEAYPGCFAFTVLKLHVEDVADYLREHPGKMGYGSSYLLNPR